jgi:ribosome-binding factor A
MAHKKPSRREMESLCAEIREDDGIDPKNHFRSFRKQSGNQRKDLQLCRQVAETLNLVLSGELRDELLTNLYVVSVTPAPDASQLLVCLTAHNGESLDERLVLDRLHVVAGRLRAEIASAITRKRAPKLVFRFLASDPRVEERS